MGDENLWIVPQPCSFRLRDRRGRRAANRPTAVNPDEPDHHSRHWAVRGGLLLGQGLADAMARWLPDGPQIRGQLAT